MGGNLLLADGKGLFLPLLVVGGGFVVIFRGQAQHRPQGLYHALLRHLVVALHAADVLHTLGGFHHHVIPRLDGQAVGVKIIILRAAPKADADDFCQRKRLLLFE